MELLNYSRIQQTKSLLAQALSLKEDAKWRR